MTHGKTTMKKEAKKKVITNDDRIAFVSKIYSKIYCEEIKDCTYFGKMGLNDIHTAIPLEIEFGEEAISFWWWQDWWSDDVKQLCEKMRNYLFGFTSGFFLDAYVNVDEKSYTEGRMTLIVDFN